MFAVSLVHFLKAEFKRVLMLQGVGHRLRGSANAVRVRAPQIGGEVLLNPFLGIE